MLTGPFLARVMGKVLLVFGAIFQPVEEKIKDCNTSGFGEGPGPGGPALERDPRGSCPHDGPAMVLWRTNS